MSDLLEFITQNATTISTVIVLTLTIYLFITINDIDLNTVQPADPTLIAQATYEPFATAITKSKHDYNARVQAATQLSNARNQLTCANCESSTHCTVLSNNSVTGSNVKDRKYRTDDNGDLVSPDACYYQNKNRSD